MGEASGVIIKEMGFSLNEFRRGLEKLTSEIMEGSATIAGTDGAVLTIHFCEQPPRKIAGLSIPVLRVALEFKGFQSPSDEKALLQRFDRAFQRGGG